MLPHSVGKAMRARLAKTIERYQGFNHALGWLPPQARTAIYLQGYSHGERERAPRREL